MFPSPGFRVTGILIFVLLIVVWLSGGAHPGWTQTQITTWHIDELTEIRYPETRDGFMPGVEFPAVGFLAMVGLVVLDLTFSKLKK